MTRSVFLEGTTLGLGAVIGGLITLPVAGFAVLPGFLGQEQHKVDLGPISTFPLGKWFITTFIVDPAEGEVCRGRRSSATTAPSPNPKAKEQVPSFTIISNRCTHLGCPTRRTARAAEVHREADVTSTR